MLNIVDGFGESILAEYRLQVVSLVKHCLSFAYESKLEKRPMNQKCGALLPNRKQESVPFFWV